MKSGVSARGRLTKEFLWVVLGQLGATVGIVATVRFLTTRLDPRQYGELAVGLTVAILVGQLLVGPLTSSLVRFFAPALETSGLPPYLSALRRLTRYFAIGFLISIAAVLIAQSIVASRWLVVAIPAICFSALSGAEQCLDGIQNAARQRKVVAFHLALGAWGRLLTAFFLFRVFGASSVTALWAYVGATALVLLSQGLFFHHRIATLATGSALSTPAETALWMGKISRFARPFAIWGAFHWALLVSDRYSLGFFRGAGAVGLFNVVYQIGYYPISIMSAVTLQLLVPILYNMAGNASDRVRLNRAKSLTKRLAFFFAGATLLAAGLALLVHGPLFELLVGPRFRSVSYLLPYMLVAAGLFMAAQIASQSPLLDLDSGSLLIPKLVTTSIGVLLNVLGAYLFGIRGVVVAGVLFSTLYFIWMMRLAMKEGIVSLPTRPHVQAVGEELAGPGVRPGQIL